MKMPRRYPPEIRRQVVELARIGTRVAQLATTFGMSQPVRSMAAEAVTVEEVEVREVAAHA